jgi:hypothetical protein
MTPNDEFATDPNPTPHHIQKRPLPFACTDGPATPLMPTEPSTMQTVAGEYIYYLCICAYQ